MRVRLPIPASWQDFEALCHGLWKEIWADPNTQRHGRSGQAQQGVDIYGTPLYSKRFSGVQCKDKDERLGATLTQSELVNECGKATGFKPGLESFTMATTAASDAAMQLASRNFNTQKTFPFDIHVWSWDEIEAELVCRPRLLSTFYPSAPLDSEANIIKISASAPQEQFQAFFNRPHVHARFNGHFRDDIIRVVYELCDNAFSHGKASNVKLLLSENSFSLEDDGTPFDSLTELDATKAGPHGHIGSFVLACFRQSYEHSVRLRYEWKNVDGKMMNLLEISFLENSTLDATNEVLDISVDFSSLFGRHSTARYVERLAIPSGLSKLVLTTSSVHNLSSFVQAVESFRQRLPDSTELVISYPQNDRVGTLASFFQTKGIIFQSR